MSVATTEKKNLSIHPRSWPGVKDGKKKDTSKGSKKTTKRTRKMLAKFDARQRSWSALPATIQKGFRKPGSRKINQGVG